MLTQNKFNKLSLFLFYCFLPLLLFSFFSTASAINSPAQSEDLQKDPLQVQAKINPFEISPGQQGQIQLTLLLPAGFHAYEEKFKLEIMQPDGFKSGKLKIKPVKEFFDKTVNKMRRGVETNSSIEVLYEAPSEFKASADKMILHLTYQACSDSFCLFPITKEISIPIVLKGVLPQITTTTKSEDATKTGLPELLSQGKIEELLNEKSLLTFVLIFIAGILTSFTPCIFPMIPITLAVLGKGSESRTRAQNFLLSIMYVLGIALTYSMLGLAAASGGSVFGSALGNHYVLGFISLIFFLMALSMYGLFEFQIPLALQQKLHTTKTGSGYFGAFITGLIAGLVASPCVGPVLVSILTFVASKKDMVFGFFILFTYALGLGLIFLALGLFNQLTKLLPKSGHWMNFVKFILGSLMLAAFYYYFNLLVSEKIFNLSLGLGLVVIASIYGAFAKLHSEKAIYSLKKGIMLTVFYIGVGFILTTLFNIKNIPTTAAQSETQSNEMHWLNYQEDLFYQAIKENKPIIIDFFAEWCAACKELEAKTFTNSDVKTLSQNFTLLRFDATHDSELLSKLKEKYKIQGLPTVLFFNSKGEWLTSLTLTEFEKADGFLERMKKAKE